MRRTDVQNDRGIRAGDKRVHFLSEFLLIAPLDQFVGRLLVAPFPTGVKSINLPRNYP